MHTIVYRAITRHTKRDLNVMLENIMMRIFTITILLLTVTGCGNETVSRNPPSRDEIAPPSGFSRDCAVWQSIPSNIISAVRGTADSKGYNLQHYWDPHIRRESTKWHFYFQGTMPDPGFSFSINFDTETGTSQLEPGA